MQLCHASETKNLYPAWLQPAPEGRKEGRKTRSIRSHTYLESVVAGEHEVAVRQDDHVLLSNPGYLGEKKGTRLK